MFSRVFAASQLVRDWAGLGARPKNSAERDTDAGAYRRACSRVTLFALGTTNFEKIEDIVRPRRQGDPMAVGGDDSQFPTTVFAEEILSLQVSTKLGKLDNGSRYVSVKPGRDQVVVAELQLRPDALSGKELPFTVADINYFAKQGISVVLNCSEITRQCASNLAFAGYFTDLINNIANQSKTSVPVVIAGEGTLLRESLARISDKFSYHGSTGEALKTFERP